MQNSKALLENAFLVVLSILSWILDILVPSPLCQMGFCKEKSTHRLKNTLMCDYHYNLCKNSRRHNGKAEKVTNLDGNPLKEQEEADHHAR